MNQQFKYTPPSMVNWYDPRQLYATALKAVISGTFASYADKRELQAALDPKRELYHFEPDQPQNGLWIDFISDTGDGFNATYTVADLAAQSLHINLDPESDSEEGLNWHLKAADLLILGGDQVYPTPTMEEYDSRFKIPFRAASLKHHKPEESSSLKRLMFAIPGNHDWYDGLGNFIKLFCQRRMIGQWHTSQRRSYYAIKLPHDIWFWAIDVQLNSDIDQPQKDYFEEIANGMHDGDRVILCTSEPAWVYKVMKRNDASYKRLKFFEHIFITDDFYGCKGGKKFKLVATLTGDLHHYSRYEEQKTCSLGKPYINQLITAGGGGAFLHPTHNLPQKLNGLYDGNEIETYAAQPQEPELKSCFPSKKASRKLANSILLFPIFNKAFWITLALIQLLLAWILQSTSQHEDITFMKQLSATDTIVGFFGVIAEHLFLNPPVLLFCLMVVIALTLFADRHAGSSNFGWLGTVHGLLQIILMFILIWLFSSLNFFNWPQLNDAQFALLFTAEMIVAGGLAGCFLMGIYLWFTNCYLNIHINESFSALSHQHFKNFIRIHITNDGVIELYPIGIKKVVTNWQQQSAGENLSFASSDSPQFFLIEKPIIIK